MVNNKRKVVKGRQTKRRLQPTMKSKKAKKMQKVTSPKCSLHRTVTLQKSPVKSNGKHFSLIVSIKRTKAIDDILNQYTGAIMLKNEVNHVAKRISSLPINDEEELDYESELLNDPDDPEDDDQIVHIKDINAQLKEIDEIVSKHFQGSSNSVHNSIAPNNENSNTQPVEDVHKASQYDEERTLGEAASHCDNDVNANESQDRKVHKKDNLLSVCITRKNTDSVDHGESLSGKQIIGDPNHISDDRTLNGAVNKVNNEDNKEHIPNFDATCDYDNYYSDSETNEPYIDDEPEVSIKNSNIFQGCKIDLDKLTIKITRNITNKRKIWVDRKWKMKRKLKDCFHFISSHSDMFFIGSRVILPEINSTFLFCDDYEVKEKPFLDSCSESASSVTSSVAGSTALSMHDSIFKLPVKRPPTRFSHKIKSTSSSQSSTIHSKFMDDASDVISLHPSISVSIEEPNSDEVATKIPKFTTGNQVVEEDKQELVNNWIHQTVRDNWASAPVSFFKPLCFLLFTDDRCTHKVCQYKHYVDDNIKTQLETLNNYDTLVEVLEYIKCKGRLFKEVFPSIAFSFSKFKNVPQVPKVLTEMIDEVLNLKLFDRTEYVEIVIKAMMDYGLSFKEAVDMIMIKHGVDNICLSDILLHLTVKQNNLRENWDLVGKLIIWRTPDQKIDSYTVKDMIKCCFSNLPPDKILYQYIQEQIIDRNLVDRSMIQEEVRSYHDALKLSLHAFPPNSVLSNNYIVQLRNGAGRRIQLSEFDYNTPQFLSNHTLEKSECNLQGTNILQSITKTITNTLQEARSDEIPHFSNESQESLKSFSSDSKSCNSSSSSSSGSSSRRSSSSSSSSTHSDQRIQDFDFRRKNIDLEKEETHDNVVNSVDRTNGNLCDTYSFIFNQYKGVYEKSESVQNTENLMIPEPEYTFTHNNTEAYVPKPKPTPGNTSKIPVEMNCTVRGINMIHESYKRIPPSLGDSQSVISSRCSSPQINFNVNRNAFSEPQVNSINNKVLGIQNLSMLNENCFSFPGITAQDKLTYTTYTVGAQPEQQSTLNRQNSFLSDRSTSSSPSPSLQNGTSSIRRSDVTNAIYRNKISPILTSNNLGRLTHDCNYVWNSSLHNLYPSQHSGVDIDNNDLVLLKRCIDVRDCKMFSKFFAKYLHETTIESFILNTLVCLQNSSNIFESFRELVDYLEDYYPDKNYVKAVSEIIALNLICFCETKGLVDDVMKILSKFSDWDSLITSKIFCSTHQYTLMGRYLYICKLYMRANDFHWPNEILQADRLNLLRPPEYWPYGHIDNRDMALRSVVLDEFFKNGYFVNLMVVNDLYKYISNLGLVEGFDTWSYFNNMLVYFLDNFRIYSSHLKILYRDIDNTYFEYIHSNILRGILLFSHGNRTDIELRSFYMKCCQRGIYPYYEGHESRIVVRNNMLDPEITVMLDCYFRNMCMGSRPPDHLVIEVKLAGVSCNFPEILNNSTRSIRDVCQSLKEILNNIGISMFLENETSIQIGHTSLLNYYRLAQSKCNHLPSY